MSIPISHFIDNYINGEPLTTDLIAWAIKKYVYMNYTPSKTEEYETYQKLLHDIALYEKLGDSDKLAQAIKNIADWSTARTAEFNEPAEETVARQNETFYKLRKVN